MTNKKTLACISALMILIFHLLIMSPSASMSDFSRKAYELGKFLRFICYTGVDIFFFISAWSMGSRKIQYKEFISNRLIHIYLKFVIFAVIQAIILNWSKSKLITTELGIQLFIKGGASFMWFIPAIMILYLVFPFYKIFDEKHPVASPLIFFLAWITLTVTLSLFTGYKEIFIFTNRLPVFLLGFYCAKYSLSQKLYERKFLYFLIAVISVILGFILSYYVYKNHIQINAVRDFNYLANLPLIAGLILLFDRIRENRFSSLISKVSLELYAVQMIIGFTIASYTVKYCPINFLANLIVFAAVFLTALAANLIFSVFYKFFKKQ